MSLILKKQVICGTSSYSGKYVCCIKIYLFSVTRNRLPQEPQHVSNYKVILCTSMEACHKFHIKFVVYLHMCQYDRTRLRSLERF